MTKLNIIVLGSSGFVGKALASAFHSNKSLRVSEVLRTYDHTHPLYFDLLDSSSWDNIVNAAPDVIVDSSGYGVVRNQQDIQTLYDINYLKKRQFFEFLLTRMPKVFWVQIGTAFEYSLEVSSLDETTSCLPKTHYGISKSLFSNYLLQSRKGRFVIFRPFGMFGEGEDMSKFFPSLILAQRNRKEINLSSGTQRRDYFYVNDLAQFILSLLVSGKLFEIDSEVINVGTGQAISLRDLSTILSQSIPQFDPGLWNWGNVAQRSDENDIFFNASSKAKKLGISFTDHNTAFQNTINYYYNL